MSRRLTLLLCLGLVLLAATPSGAGTVDVSWTAPVTNVDGSPLSDLASYRVYYGTSNPPCPGAAFLPMASSTPSPPANQTVAATLTGLSTGTLYYIAVTAVDTSGSESACSPAASAVARVDFAVSPTGTVNFGSVTVGNSADQTYTVQNTVGGTVAGTASTSAPFSIFSGGSFSLVGVGASQTVTVRFTPTTATTSVASVNFTANGGALSRSVTGTGMANLNPTPAISSLTPASVAAGGAAFTLAVNGTGFVSGATATVGGVGRTVSFVSGTQLTVAVLAADLAVPGTVNVVVTNPGPCVATGCVSNSAGLSVTAPPTAPVLTGISPATVAAGSGNVVLTATGQSFAASSVVQVNGTARATTYGSATSLTATVLASDLAQSGTLSITVFTPAPGGGTSVSAMLTVVAPALSATPVTGPPGSPLTVTLTNWGGGAMDWLALAQVGAANTSTVTWLRVSALPGTGGTKTWATTLPATPGQYEARLFLNNTYTLAATSDTITVADINPTPAIGSLTPARVAPGSAAFTLTVNGRGFVSGITATVGGAVRTVSFVSGTQLRVGVLAADVAARGTVNVVVTNPGPCVATGCVSNPGALNVRPGRGSQ